MSETVGTPAATGAPALKPNNPFEATSRSILNITGPVTKMAQSFDRSMHQPFRLDHKGFNKDVSVDEQIKKESYIQAIAKEEAKIPTWWKRGDKTNLNRTLTEL